MACVNGWQSAYSRLWNLHDLCAWARLKRMGRFSQLSFLLWQCWHHNVPFTGVFLTICSLAGLLGIGFSWTNAILLATCCGACFLGYLGYLVIPSSQTRWWFQNSDLDPLQFWYLIEVNPGYLGGWILFLYLLPITNVSVNITLFCLQSFFFHNTGPWHWILDNNRSSFLIRLCQGGHVFKCASSGKTISPAI